MSDYLVQRGAALRRYPSAAILVRAIEDGEVEEGDEIRGPGASVAIPCGVHPQFASALLDEEDLDGGPAPEVEVDLTPMIDVTFLLLIFFMTTTLVVMFKSLDAPGSKDDGKASGPRKVPTRSEVAAQHIFVTVHADGSAQIGLERIVGREGIAKALEREMAIAGKRTIVIEAADGVRHGDVVQVLDAAASARTEKVLFAKRVTAPAKGR